jgi:hypothetical protein
VNRTDQPRTAANETRNETGKDQLTAAQVEPARAGSGRCRAAGPADRCGRRRGQQADGGLEELAEELVRRPGSRGCGRRWLRFQPERPVVSSEGPEPRFPAATPQRTRSEPHRGSDRCRCLETSQSAPEGVVPEGIRPPTF